MLRLLTQDKETYRRQRLHYIYGLLRFGVRETLSRFSQESFFSTYMFMQVNVWKAVAIPTHDFKPWKISFFLNYFLIVKKKGMVCFFFFFFAIILNRIKNTKSEKLHYLMKGHLEESSSDKTEVSNYSLLLQCPHAYLFFFFSCSLKW